jgi:membrane-associated phospholipid phosphatase
VNKKRTALVLIISIAIMSQLPALSRGDVNPIDRWAMFPYSVPLSVTSDATQYLSFLSPALFTIAVPSSDWLHIGLLYGASVALSYGSRVLLKHAIHRVRPYEYFPSAPDYPPSLEDSNQSFPSGHSIMAFTGAGFTQMLFTLRYPKSPYRLPVTITAWTLAASTAVLRVASGNHFISDVLAGATIGSLFGMVVPFLAWKYLPTWQQENMQVIMGPSMMAIYITL